MARVEVHVAYLARVPLDFSEVGLGELHTLLVLGQQLLRGVLGERTLNHLFDLQRLDSQQVENHVVGEPELRPKLGGLAEHHVPQIGDGGRLVAAGRDNDDEAHGVQTAPAGSSGHLRVLAGQQVAEGVAVVFAVAGEHDRPCRQVQAHSECFSCEQDLDQCLGEQDLNEFLHDWKQSAVMDGDATGKQASQAHDLRQHAVLGL